MRKTGYLYDLRYLLHDTGPYHPEVPERLKMIHQGIEDAGLLSSLAPISPIASKISHIETVHDISYIRRFEETCYAGFKTFDYPDNQMCIDTFETALLAAGGVVTAVKEVVEGVIDNAFCSVRPPGHHAEFDKAMGFCYFNNIALAARYLRNEKGIGRVGIIDFDVHHGNGTQHLFEKDPTVFYYSIHEHPSFAFPGTGREFEKGEDSGEGFTLNSPILPGKGDEEYKRILERELFPAFDSFRPEFILLSTGFDAHEDDDMSGIRLSTPCFKWIMERIMEMADKFCDGKMVSVLEGGYSLKRLPELAKDHIAVMMKD